MTATQKFTKGLRVFASDIAQGFFEITHNGFALLGLAVMFACITLVARPEMRQAGEVQLISWLQDRQDGGALHRCACTGGHVVHAGIQGLRAQGVRHGRGPV